MLDFSSRAGRIRVFWILLALTALVFVGMQISGAPLKNAVAPAGIISFEFAGNLEKSQAIVSSWQGETMLWAGLNMGLDFLFLIMYSSTLALGCYLVAQRVHHPGMKNLGLWLVAAMYLAACLDIAENLALIELLQGWDCSYLPVMAKWMAIPKFILVLLGILYVLVGSSPLIKKADQELIA